MAHRFWEGKRRPTQQSSKQHPQTLSTRFRATVDCIIHPKPPSAQTLTTFRLRNRWRRSTLTAPAMWQGSHCREKKRTCWGIRINTRLQDSHNRDGSMEIRGRPRKTGRVICGEYTCEFSPSPVASWGEPHEAKCSGWPIKSNALGEICIFLNKKGSMLRQRRRRIKRCDDDGSPPPHTASGELLHENVEAMEVLVGVRLQPQGPRRLPGGIPLGCGVGPSVSPLGGGSHRSDGSHPNNIMKYLLLCFQVMTFFSIPTRSLSNPWKSSLLLVHQHRGFA